MRRVGLLSFVVLALLVPATAQADPFSEYPSGATLLQGQPQQMTIGPDGAVWFTEQTSNRIGRLNPAGAPGQFSIGPKPLGITAGPDGNVYFTELGGTGKIGRMATDGTGLVEKDVPSGGGQPTGIVTGPDGALWFTEYKDNEIRRVTTGWQFSVMGTASGPTGITVGPDGALWFTERDAGKVSRITTGGIVTRYDLPDSASGPDSIVSGPDGALWFTEADAGAIGRITTDGRITEFRGLTVGAAPGGITLAADGNLWFTENGLPGGVGQLTPDGSLREWPTPVASKGPLGIAAGPDGALWFAESGAAKLGRLTTAPGVATAPATDATGSTATLSGSVRPAGQTTSYYFDYGPSSSYGSRTAMTSAGAGTGTVAASATVGGLSSGTTYHFRLVATNATETTVGPDRTFITVSAAADPLAPSPLVAGPASNSTPPSPVLGQSVVVGAASGQVTVRLKGTSSFVPLSGAVSVPTGSELDTSRGTVTLVSALDAQGKTQSGTFNGGRFKVVQSKSGRGMIDLYLSGPKPGRCVAANRTSKSYAAKTKKKTRSLWGRDSHGRFRTHGRDSVATVRGTRWYTQDRCDGTLTRVTQGAVSVRDLHRKRTKVVRAGHSYLARRR